MGLVMNVHPKDGGKNHRKQDGEAHRRKGGAVAAVRFACAHPTAGVVATLVVAIAFVVFVFLPTAGSVDSVLLLVELSVVHVHVHVHLPAEGVFFSIRFVATFSQVGLGLRGSEVHAILLYVTVAHVTLQCKSCSNHGDEDGKSKLSLHGVGVYSVMKEFYFLKRIPYWGLLSVGSYAQGSP